MAEEEILRKCDKYCLEKYGRTWKVSETNENNPDFAKLPLDQCIDIIEHVWTIDFDEEDDITLQTGTFKEKVKVLVYRLCRKKIGKAYTDDFVDSVFFFVQNLLIPVCVTWVVLYIAYNLLMISTIGHSY